MAAIMQQYRGVKVCLTSHSLIRYIGTLEDIDSQKSTISVSNVTSFGTEGRLGGVNEIPPADRQFDFISFRASDVKNLRVCDEQDAPPPPPPNQVPNDPAILSTARPMGMPPTVGVSGPMHPSVMQQRWPPQYHPAYAQGMPPIPGPGQAPVSMPPPQMMPPQPQQPQQQQQQRGPQPPTSQPIQQPQNRPQPPPQQQQAQNQQQQPQSTPTTTQPMTMAQAVQMNRPQTSEATQPTRTIMAGQTQPSQVPAPRQPASQSSQAPSGEMNGRPPRAPRADGASRPPRSRRGGRGRGSATSNGTPTPGATRVAVPRSDFDFEQANAKFSREELIKELTKMNISVSDGKESDKPETPLPTLDVKDSLQKFFESAGEKFYDHKTSFFDNISCDAKERMEHVKGDRRQNMSAERQLNMETFGQSSVDNVRYNGYRRGRGYGRGYRGYRGRGRGRGGRGGGPRDNGMGQSSFGDRSNRTPLNGRGRGAATNGDVPQPTVVASTASTSGTIPKAAVVGPAKS